MYSVSQEQPWTEVHPVRWIEGLDSRSIVECHGVFTRHRQGKRCLPAYVLTPVDGHWM